MRGSVVRRLSARVDPTSEDHRTVSFDDAEPAPLLSSFEDADIRRAAEVRGRYTEFERVVAVRSTVPSVALSDVQVRSFLEDGFLAVADMSSAEEVALIREIYDDLFERQEGRAYGLYGDATQEAHLRGEYTFPKIHQIYRMAPELCATGFMANARAISEQIFGAQVQFLGGHGFLKPAFSLSETAWHQDQAYHRPDLLFRGVNFWLALQDTPLECGVMEFARGSHRASKVFAHHRPGGDSESSGLELVDLPDPGEVVPCPLRAGGATLHHSYVSHHTPPNETAEPRRALIAIFGLDPVERSEPLQFPWQAGSDVRPVPGSGPRPHSSATE